MDYEFAYDVSNFLDASIEKVLHTLLEAFILVSLVVYMFLGDLRSTLIPTLAVPVSLIGTFFCPAVVRPLDQPDHALRDGAGDRRRGGRRDRGGRGGACQDGREAPVALPGDHGGVHEICGAIIAITLVMTSVFVPVTFIPGPVGTFYRQFGITMATSIILSGLVALTLTPVLCAMILKPHAHADTTTATRHEPREKARADCGSCCCMSLAGCWSWAGSLIWRMSCGGRSASCSSFCPSCGVLSTAPSRRSRAVMPRSCGGSSRAAR